MRGGTRERSVREETADRHWPVKGNDLGTDGVIALEMERDGYSRSALGSGALAECRSGRLDLADDRALSPEPLSDEDRGSGRRKQQPDHRQRDRVERASGPFGQAPEALSEPRITTTDAPPACGRISGLIGSITPIPTADATLPAASLPAGSK